MPPSESPRAYETTSQPGQPLTVVIRKEFDFGNLHQDWAQSIISMHPGPHPQVRFDLSRCGIVSSTFFAGLVQIVQNLGQNGKTPIVLVHPDPRLVKNLTILQLHRLFVIEPRPA